MLTGEIDGASFWRRLANTNNSPLTGEDGRQRVGVSVGVEVVSDEWVVVEHLLGGRDLDHVAKVGLLLARVVACRHVPVDAHVAVVLVRSAELVQQLRNVTCSEQASAVACRCTRATRCLARIVLKTGSDLRGGR